jgi:hypothetical protein
MTISTSPKIQFSKVPTLPKTFISALEDKSPYQFLTQSGTLTVTGGPVVTPPTPVITPVVANILAQAYAIPQVRIPVVTNVVQQAPAPVVVSDTQSTVSSPAPATETNTPTVNEPSTILTSTPVVTQDPQAQKPQITVIDLSPNSKAPAENGPSIIWESQPNRGHSNIPTFCYPTSSGVITCSMQRAG